MGQGLNPNVLNDFAWFLATCPDDFQRNGKEAVRLATKACVLTQWGVRNFVGTLAAAYAEFGDFDKAVNYLRQAMDLQAGYPSDTEMEQTLRRYNEHKPFRISPGH
jgi:hypothetical protein